jgi:hypothetical protein
MSRFPCPYLEREVELTAEREFHIAERHPDLLPAHRQRVAETPADPDQVRRSVRFGSAVHRGCSRDGTLIEPNVTERYWVITAYMTRKLAAGEIEWRRV